MKRLKCFSRAGAVMTLVSLFMLTVGAHEAVAKSNKSERDRSQRNIALTVAVKGGGKVTSSPEGISCNAGVCKAEFPRGTVVRLYATPEDGQYLASWRGACGGSKRCKIRLKRPRKVLAYFKKPRPVPLMVYVRGGGKVTSTPEGISCDGGKCKGEFPRGTVVRLHATPEDGQYLAGWRGACGGKKRCNVRLKRPRKVLAVFKKPRQIPLALMVKGEGTVSSNPEGLNCEEGICAHRFPRGTVVTLTAKPEEGHSFSHWRGACRGSENCQVKLKWRRKVLAVFKPDDPLNNVVLSVTMKGKGKVTGSPEGLSCADESCTAEYPRNAVVTLKAAPGDGHVFAEWGGACKGQEGCTVTLTDATSVTAAFELIPPPNVALTVTYAGEGIITSAPEGLSCDDESCTGEFPPNTVVTLKAVPAEGQVFAEWGGACKGMEGCTVTLTEAKSVTAAFESAPPPNVVLTVTYTGEGKVISNPEGLVCEKGTCTGQFPQGKVVSLTPMPGENQVFSEWKGACTGSEGCTVTLNAATTVMAAFIPPPPPPNIDLSVSIVGDGSVISSPTGITCPTGDCTVQFPSGTPVTLSATPNIGQQFVGWSGDCTGATCSFTLSATTSVTANFIASTSGGMTDAEAIRFLEQSTWGPTPASIAHLKTVGKDAFLAEQFAAPFSTYPDPSDESNSLGPLHDQWFHNAFHGQDQLRQRVAFALGQLFVVSSHSVGSDDQMIPYQRMLKNNAFGNFYDLMRDVTLSPTMGRYLDMVNNDRTEPGSGLNPNENYARELLQLFSIGLKLLNLDGSEVVDASGQPIPTYDQDVIINLARVFTGWTYPTRPGEIPRWRNPSYYAGPMEAIESHHDTEQKVLMNGFVIPANGTAQEDLDAALTHIFQHQNVAPFVATRLIRHLVTSNPSPAYIQRVTDAFNGLQSGVRGDMQAVIRAVLMDPEAATVMTDGGHLREPILYAIALLRALNADVQLDNPLFTRTRDMGQPLFAAHHVFNFFSPLYKIPGTNLFGPEYEIHTLTNTIARTNFVNRMVNNQLGGGVTVDLSPFEAVAADAGQLVAAVERALLHDNLSDADRQSIITAVSATSNATTRARIAIYLVATSAKYQVQH